MQFLGQITKDRAGDCPILRGRIDELMHLNDAEVKVLNSVADDVDLYGSLD